MVHLTIAGRSADKSRLLLVDDAGTEFTVDIDARLRAALGGDAARIGQLEIQMESTFRPRDIQARIRAGQTAEEVALAAQTSVERVMPYAAPVLAERGHMAERAQRASVRRVSGEPGARTLGEAAGARLRAENVPADSVAWDAWRRQDSRWTLTAAFSSESRSGTATFSYDPPGNFVIADDDDARWLIGDRPATPSAPPDELRSARERRLTPVAGELPLSLTDPSPIDPPLGDDALDLLAEEPQEELVSTAADTGGSEEETADLSETVSHVRAVRVEAIHPQEDTLGAEPPPEAFLDSVLRADPSAPAEPAVPVQIRVDESDENLDEPRRRAVKKNRGRASVPSWDEIMFGGRQE
jgi:hypothetical protein